MCGLNGSHAFKFTYIGRREQSDKTFYKMNKIKFLASLLSMAVCISFTSCDDDENNADNTGTGNVFPEGTKLISTINDGYETTTFNYDSGKLISVKEGNEKEITFKYEGDDVIMTVTYKEDNDKEVVTLNIGSNGFATGGHTSDGDTFAFTYTGDYLTAFTMTDGEYEEDDSYQLTWENGNITKVTRQYPGDNNSVVTRVSTSTYETELNKAGLSFFEEVTIDLDELEYVYYAGLLGKSTTNLLKSTDDSDGYAYSYSYELNADKYPTKMTESYFSGGSTYPYSSSITLTYK